MIDATDIKGIGPTKAETLAEEGYETVEDIAEAEREELASIKGVGEDRALEYMVGASDLLEAEEEVEEETNEDEFDLTPSEVSEELEEREESESQDDSDVSESDSKQEETEDDGDEEQSYEVSLEFDEKLEYDVYHAALMSYHEKVYTSNQPASDAIQKALTGLTDFDEVQYELSEFELNTLHTAIKQCRTDYQGDNLIDHMDALKKIEGAIDEQRREYLF